ncbi:MAG: hypothetical protein ACLUE8_05820 [Lachnospiraceae bacterium]
MLDDSCDAVLMYSKDPSLRRQLLEYGNLSGRGRKRHGDRSGDGSHPSPL